MEIRVQSIKFNADQKLLDFTEKKLSKLSRFHEGITDVEVVMSLLADHDNKNIRVHVRVPGHGDIVVERNARTFEDAIVDCADILKEKLTRIKEKEA